MFNVVAQLQLQGPTGLGQVISNLNNALRGVNPSVELRVNASSMADVNRQVNALNAGLASTRTAASAASASVAGVGSTASASASRMSLYATGAASAASSTRMVGRAAAEAAPVMEQLGALAGLSARRFTAFVLASQSINALTSSFRSGIGEALAFERELVKIKQISTESAEEIAGIATEVRRVSTTFGVSSQEMLKVAEQLKQTGLSAAQVKEAIQPLAEASLSPSFGDIAKTTQGAIAAIRQFKIETRDLGAALGSINALSSSFAVESNDLIEAVKKAGGQFKSVGGDLNEFMALFTAVRSTTRESAEEIATGLRTIFSRLQRPQTVQALKELNIELRYTAEEATRLGDVDLTNQFVGSYEAVRRLSEGLASLRTTDPRFAQISQQLGGYEQISRIIPLVRQFGEAQRALTVAQNGSLSLQRSTDQAQEATLVRITKVREEYLKLFSALTQSNGFKLVANTAILFANSLAGILNTIKPLMPLLTTMATLRIFTGLGGFFGRAAGQFSGAGIRQPVTSIQGRGFAEGGVVPGVGDTDCVSARLMPGEFVIKKRSAQRIGYDRLHQMNRGGSVRRMASGGAVRLSDGGDIYEGQHFAEGGPVVTAASVRKILDEFRETSGIDFSKVVGGIRLDPGLTSKRAAAANALKKKLTTFGFYRTDDKGGPLGQIILNSSAIKTETQLRRVLGHELGHAVDRFGGTYREMASTEYGSEHARFAERYANELRTRDERAGNVRTGEFGSYRYSNKEGFAETFKDYLLGKGQRGFGRRVVEQVAKATNKDYQEKDLGFMGNLARRKGVLGGVARWFGYASGGECRDGTDCVPALLTPGEFVVNRDAVARVGLGNLHRMNAMGVQKFAHGGYVRRFAEGGFTNGEHTFSLEGGVPDLSKLAGPLNLTAEALLRFNNAVMLILRDLNAYDQSDNLKPKAVKGVSLVASLEGGEVKPKGLTGGGYSLPGNGPDPYHLPEGLAEIYAGTQRRVGLAGLLANAPPAATRVPLPYGEARRVDPALGNSAYEISYNKSDNKKLVWLGYGVNKGLTDDERAAVGDYTRGGDEAVNTTLRDPSRAGEFPGDTPERIATLRRAVAKGRIPGGQTIYRGIDAQALEAIQASSGVNLRDPSSVGSEFTEAGFSSASLNKETGEEFAKAYGRGGVNLRVRTGSGLTGLSVENFSKKKGEHEAILQAGTRYRVVEAGDSPVLEVVHQDDGRRHASREAKGSLATPFLGRVGGEPVVPAFDPDASGGQAEAARRAQIDAAERKRQQEAYEEAVRRGKKPPASAAEKSANVPALNAAQKRYLEKNPQLVGLASEVGQSLDDSKMYGGVDTANVAQDALLHTLSRLEFDERGEPLPFVSRKGTKRTVEQQIRYKAASLAGGASQTARKRGVRSLSSPVGGGDPDSGRLSTLADSAQRSAFYSGKGDGGASDRGASPEDVLDDPLKKFPWLAHVSDPHLRRQYAARAEKASPEVLARIQKEMESLRSGETKNAYEGLKNITKDVAPGAALNISGDALGQVILEKGTGGGIKAEDAKARATLDRTAAAGGRRGRGGRAPVDYRQQAISDLSALGVDVLGGAANPADTNSLRRLRGVAGRVPESARELFAAAGSKLRVSTGSLTQVPGLENLPDQEKLAQASGIAGAGPDRITAIDLPGALADVSAVTRGDKGRSRPGYGGSTLLHERGHDFDRVLGDALSRAQGGPGTRAADAGGKFGTRVSAGADFLSVLPDFSKHVDANPAIYANDKAHYKSNPREAFAEAFSRYNFDPNTKAQLPGSVIAYFDNLLKLVENNKKALVALASGSAKTATLEAPTGLRTDQVAKMKAVEAAKKAGVLPNRDALDPEAVAYQDEQLKAERRRGQESAGDEVRRRRAEERASARGGQTIGDAEMYGTGLKEGPPPNDHYFTEQKDPVRSARQPLTTREILRRAREREEAVQRGLATEAVTDDHARNFATVPIRRGVDGLEVAALSRRTDLTKEQRQAEYNALIQKSRADMQAGGHEIGRISTEDGPLVSRATFHDTLGARALYQKRIRGAKNAGDIREALYEARRGLGGDSASYASLLRQGQTRNAAVGNGEDLPEDLNAVAREATAGTGQRPYEDPWRGYSPETPVDLRVQNLTRRARAQELARDRHSGEEATRREERGAAGIRGQVLAGLRFNRSSNRLRDRNLTVDWEDDPFAADDELPQREVLTRKAGYSNAAEFRDGALVSVAGEVPPDRKQAARAARDNAGIGGVTDPLRIKQEALQAIEAGKGGQDLLKSVRRHLSPAQYAQVVKAHQKAGFGVKDADVKRLAETVDKAAEMASANADQNTSMRQYDLYQQNSAAGAGGRRYELPETTTPITPGRGDRFNAEGVAPSEFNQTGSTSGFLRSTMKLDARGNPILNGYGAPVIDKVGIVDEQASVKAAARVAARGPVVSEKTQEAIRTSTLEQEEVQVKRELVSAQKRLLKALHPTITNTELHNKAEEDVAKALRGEAEVVRGKNGKLLGLKDTVAAATAANVSAPGAGGLSYGAGSILSGVGSFVSDPSRAPKWAQKYNQFFENSKLGAGINYTLLMAAPMVAQGVSHLGGTAEKAAITGEEGQYKTAQAVSGALQGAVLGATVGGTVGSLIPVVGTAIGATAGAVAGGLYGAVNAFREAEKEIRDVKIGNALKGFTDKLEALANLGTDASAESTAYAKESLATYIGQSKGKNTDEASSIWTGLDATAYSDLQQKSLRTDLGGQLPQMSQALSRSAEQIVKHNPDADVDRTVLLLREGNQGINKEFIDIIARIRQIPVAEVEKELRKSIEGFRRAQVADEAARKAAMGEDRNVNAFGRLLLSLQSAADGLTRLTQVSQMVADTFDGVVNATRITISAQNLSQLGRQDHGALATLDTVAAVGGDQGQKLREVGGTADEVARLLPSILANITSRGLSGEHADKDFATQVATALRDALPKTDQSEQAIATVTRGLYEAGRERGVEGIHREVQVDTTRFAEKLLAPYSEAVKDAGGRVAMLLEDNANRYIDGLTRFRAQLALVGENMDRLASIRVSSAVGRAEILADQGGYRRDALSRVPLTTLMGADRARQERLTQFVGAAATDPTAIARQLDVVRERLKKATVNQQQVFETTGGKGPAFEAAAEQLVNLKDQAANLQQALKNLADASQRNAGVQEKLAKIHEDRDARLAFGERYISTDLEGRQQMNRGMVLANAAATRGNLDGLMPGDQRLVMDTLKSFGNARLTGFEGSPLAADVLEKLVKNTMGGVFQVDDNRKDEQTRLQQQVLDNLAKAEQAQAALVEAQKTMSQDFFSTLKQLQTEFFERLGRNLSRDAETDKANRAGMVGKDRQRLEGLRRQRDILAPLGITRDDQLSRGREAIPDIEAYATARGRLRALDPLRAKADDGTAKFLFDDVYRDIKGNTVGGLWGQTGARDRKPLADLTDRLMEQGFTDKQAGSIAARYKTNVRNAKKEFSGIGDSEAQLVGALQSAIRDEIEAEARRLREGTLDPAAKKLGNRNIDAGRLDALLDDKAIGLGKVVAALNAFDGTSNKLDGLDKSIETTTQLFDKLNQEIEDLKKRREGAAARPAGPAVPLPGVNLATGGDVAAHPGAPRGTDTVPAWLTPGEFVVNARAAKEHMGLLRRLNGGATYSARGGPVGYFEGGGAVGPEAAREAERQRVKAWWDDLGRTGGFPAQGEELKAFKARFGGPDFSRGRLNQFLLMNWESMDPKSQGYYKAWLDITTQWEGEQSLAAKRGLSDLRRAELLKKNVDPAAGAVGPAEFKARYDKALQAARQQVYTDDEFEGLLGHLPGQGGVEGRNKATAEVEQVRQNLAGMTPEKQAWVRGLREKQAERIRANAAWASRDKYDENKLPAEEKAILVEDYRYRFEDQFQAFARAKLADQKAYWEKNKQYTQPEFLAKLRTSPEEFTLEERGYYATLNEAYQQFQREAPAIEARELKEAQDAQLAAAREKAREQFPIDEDIVNKELKKQARLNPFGASGLVVGRQKLIEQWKRSKPGLLRSGLLTERNLENVLAVQRFAGRQANLARQQMAARSEKGPLTGFGRGRVEGASQGNVFISSLKQADQYNHAAGLRDPRQVQAQVGRLPENRLPILGFATGGLVSYLSGGGSTDTVPGMLTPGEFVFSKKAVDAIGAPNLANMHHFATGGLVGGGSTGPAPSGGSGISPEVATALSRLGESLNGFSTAATGLMRLSTAFDGFLVSADKLAKALEGFPHTINLEGQQRVEVIFNGAEVLARITPDLKEMMEGAIKDKLNEVFKHHLPDAGVNLE